MKEGLKNLAQQMRITDAELRARMGLMGMTQKHSDALKSLHGRAMSEVDALVAEFYAHQLSVPIIRGIIGDQDTFVRLRGAMRAYVIRMFEGNYDLTYANSRLRVGKVHARIGVPPKLYVSSLHRLEGLIAARIAADDRQAREALGKLFLLDLQFAFDAYIQGLVDEVSLARDEIQSYSESLEEVIRERTAEATRFAETDPLSGLRSRQSFEEVLRRQWEIASSTAVHLSVALIDLDRFKQINDTLGHLEGDRVIQTLGQVILSEKRAGDLAYRIGGDEFCLIFPLAQRTEARGVCERLQARLADALGGLAEFSFGIASVREADGAQGPRDLLAQADAELYAMKARRPARLLSVGLAESA